MSDYGKLYRMLGDYAKPHPIPSRAQLPDSDRDELMTTTTHTPATLAALPLRELDALAHEAVFPDHNTMWINATRCVFVRREGGDDWGSHPEYSRDLNHAALLEAELARRGLEDAYDAAMCIVPDSTGYPMIGARRIVWLRASAKQRTIAAILAAQESPYLNIVTWDKHPRDAQSPQ